MIDEAILLSCIHSRRQRIERFIAMDSETGCHIWTGGTDEGGYGTYMPLRDVRVAAQRVTWALHHKQLPAGKLKNECGRKHCVNPAHWCTQKGRSKRFTAEQCAQIKAEYIPYITTLGELAKRYRVSVSAICFAMRCAS